MMSENTKKIWEYLKEQDGANVTAADIADALDLPIKTVNGAVTAGLQRKGLAERIPATIEVTNEEGNVVEKDVKFIKITSEGKSFDPDAEA